MLTFLTVLIMLIVCYAYWREGILTAMAMACNVFLAGLVAYAFWEPMADVVEDLVWNTFLHGYEDCLCMMVLFCLTLGILRLITNNLASTEMEFPALLQQGGALLFALLTGYLVAGFLVCMLQTLPWQENFLGFDSRVEAASSANPARRLFPPDRVWLGLMQRASIRAFSWGSDSAFDPDGNFELRYGRLRRYKAEGSPASSP
jgi:hypothetical protein